MKIFLKQVSVSRWFSEAFRGGRMVAREFVVFSLTFLITRNKAK